MRKQALIHVHSLVDEIASFCSEDDVVVDFEEYRSIGTRPTSIHLSKSDHEAAVFELVESITAALPDEREEQEAEVVASAD